jgi:ribosome biogenesis protein YTM1
MSTETELEQVQVRFTTQQQEYAITESAIFVPANFKRYGLSGIVNHLLGNGKDSRIFCTVLESIEV